MARQIQTTHLEQGVAILDRPEERPPPAEPPLHPRLPPVATSVAPEDDRLPAVDLVVTLGAARVTTLGTPGGRPPLSKARQMMLRYEELRSSVAPEGDRHCVASTLGHAL